MEDISHRTENPYFLIYQMGKVGSTSIMASLQKQFGSHNVKHTHNHVAAQRMIQERRTEGRSVIVITGFREPLSRCISAYFQNIDSPTNRYWFVGSKDEVLGKSIDWLIADYIRKARIHIPELVAPWLSMYETSTGLSFADFEKRDGMWKGSAGRLSCYVYKLENISDFIDAISTEPFLSGTTLLNKNQGGEKWSGDLYREFNNKFRVTWGDYLSLYGQLDYVKLLYDDSEVRHLTTKYVI